MNPTLYQLRQRARAGDRQAVAAIRDHALQAIAILDTLTDHTPGHPEIPEAIREGVAAAHDVAAHSLRWPVVWDAIKERREEHLGKASQDKRHDGKGRVGRLGIGGAIGIMLNGQGRGFSYDEQTGFAEDVFQQLEAIRRNPAAHVHPADAHPELEAPGVLADGQRKRSWQNLAAMLEPLTKATLSAWADAGRELCRDWCENEWSRFPWPQCVIGKIGSPTDGNGSECDGEKAVRDKIKEGLKKLL